MAKTKRGISDDFIEELKNSGLLALYQSHKDELFLAIRNNYINLYYNCASVCRVEYHPRAKQKLQCYVHKKYLGKTITEEEKEKNEYYDKKTPQYIIENYESIKKRIKQVYTLYKHKEKYTQQKLVLNTNLNPNANWYCIDIEYIKQRNSSEEIPYGRWDIIAISKRKNKNGKHRVALIELKCSDDAISGESGIVKHARDYIKFIEKGKYKTYKEHLKPELLNITEDLKKLEIYDLNIKNPEELEDKPEFYFITLENKRDHLIKTMRKYIFDSEPGHAKKTIQKEEGIDITKKNNKKFTPTFLFSDQGFNTTINDILDQEQYDGNKLEVREENLPRKNCPTIIIHRGTHQIGGCVTEIRSKNGMRIAIDIGENLPSLKEQKQLKIPGLTKNTRYTRKAKVFDAVFVTHYHGDHIGLYDVVLDEIPIYTGEHTKIIYKKLQERVLKGKVYHKEITPREKEKKLQKIDTFKNYNEYESKNGIKVTPIKSDHSAFDSHMLLIECDGKRILHTGDFRAHGIMGDELINSLKKVGKVDYLICEGTTLSRNNLENEENCESIESEEDIGKKAEEIFKNNKYNFVFCSSTNIDRIAYIHKAAINCSRIFICDDYQNEILQYVDSVAKSEKLDELYRFNQDTVNYYEKWQTKNLEENAIKNGFVMLVRTSYYPKKLMKRLMKKVKNNYKFIYSMWEGYLNEEYKELYKDTLELVPEKYISLHTSGHADKETIKNIVGILKPKVIIPIHGEIPEMFEDLDIENCTIDILYDKEEYYL